MSEKFSKEAIQYAIETQSKYGVPASVTLAQYALESGYGTSSLAVNHNNYFGITGSFNGNSYRDVNGRNWRVYSSMRESFDDHGNLLANSGLYDSAKYASNVTEYVNAIAETYAPSSDGNNNYAGNILQIISDNNLTKYDSVLLNYDNNLDKNKFYTPGITAGTIREYAEGFTPSREYAEGFTTTRDYADDWESQILQGVVKGIAIVLILVVGVVFFMQAFDLKMPTKKSMAKKAKPEVTE